MLHRIVINIAGGHYAGALQTTKEIENKLLGIFKHDVRVIDLDERAIAPRQYSDKDYDFEAIIHEIKNISSKGDLVIILVCGCYSLFDSKLCDLSSLKVFVDSDGDKRLINLIQQKHVITGYDLESCISYYMDHLRPEMINYIDPSKTKADIIIPSANDALGTAIIVDGIVKVVEQYQGGGSNDTKKLFPQLDFNLERMELQKERYYELS
ncbi:Das2 [Kluyveromyces lactis]|nr:Das2 [Kluyveromyces lactis]